MVSPSVAAPLDRTKLTDRRAVYVLSAAAQSFGYEVSELNINRCSIRRYQQKYRPDAGVALTEELQGGFTLIVHWDGKLTQDLTSNIM